MPDVTEVVQPEVIQVAEPQLSQEQKAVENQLAFIRGEESLPFPEIDAAEDVQQETAQAAATEEKPATVEGAVVAPDYNSFVKEKFGVDTIEEAENQWKELQELKSKASATPTVKMLTIEEIKEAAKTLALQERLDSLISDEVTEGNAAEIVKENMRLKYAGLTAAQLEYKFNKMYGVPDSPVAEDFDTTTAFEKAEKNWNKQVEDAKTELLIDANLAKPDLVKIKSELKPINIQQPQSDEDYEAFKASKASASESMEKIIIPAIKSLKEGDVRLGFKVQDPNSQMDFDIALTPTKESFEKARQNYLSFDDFVKMVCWDKDGKFTPERMQRMILLDENFDNYRQSIARQAVNAERKRVIAKATGQNGQQREFVETTATSEFERQLAFARS